MNITPKELALLVAIAQSEYRNAGLREPVWTFDLGPARSVGGVMSSLAKKGLVEAGGKVSGDGATVSLTDVGIAALPEDVRAPWGGR
jgi:hypothetical protein